MPGTISIVIPSRLATGPGASGKLGRLFLERAIETIRTQTIFDPARTQIIVGVDAGANTPADLAAGAAIEFAQSAGHSQAAALNAAARHIRGDFAAFLEDDDQWGSLFLENGLVALTHCGFVSSTQLEVTEDAMSSA
jgi:hypothetical protein